MKVPILCVSFQFGAILFLIFSAFGVIPSRPGLHRADAEGSAGAVATGPAAPVCAPHFAPCVEWAWRQCRDAWVAATGHFPMNTCGFDKLTRTPSGGRRRRNRRTCQSRWTARSWLRSATLSASRPAISAISRLTRRTFAFMAGESFTARFGDDGEANVVDGYLRKRAGARRRLRVVGRLEDVLSAEQCRATRRGRGPATRPGYGQRAGSRCVANPALAGIACAMPHLLRRPGRYNSRSSSTS